MSLFVASAAFGDVHVSLCVAGAALVKFMCHFSWQAQHLVKLMCHFSWQVQHLVKFMCHFLWQAQHLVKFMCHFSWQVQHVVKFGMIAGAGNVVIFNRICSWRVRKVASGGAAGCGLRFLMVGSFSDHSRIVLGSWSDRSRIGNATSPVFSKFLSDVGWSFCVAGAVFGEVGGCCLLLRAL